MAEAAAVAQATPAQPALSIEERMLNAIKAPPGPAENPKPEPAPEPEKPETPAEEEKPAEAPVEEIELDLDAPLMEITVKTEDGRDETRKWSLAELRKSVMLEKDYRHKTAQLAREREAIPQEIQKNVQQLNQAYVERLNVVQNAVAKVYSEEIGNVDLNKLSRDDPAEFVRVTARANQLQQIFYTVQQEQANLKQQQDAAVQQELAKRVAESVEVLQRDIPNWSNEHYANLLKTGREVYGFKQEEIANVTDARMIKVLNDAYQYQALKASKPLVDKRLSVVPKVLKPSAQAQTERSDETSEAAAQARKRLRASGGKDQDALAALILNRMHQGRA